MSVSVDLSGPTAFADSRPLTPSELRSAPVRWPRPSALAVALAVDGAKAQAGALSLGLVTVGDLLEHLPRDRREARAIAQLIDGEAVTIVVEVRSIHARPVRRRGMKPLVEATVADSSGATSVTFFNQPWLAHRYPTGTRLVLHGTWEPRRGFRVSGHAMTASAGVGGAEGTDAVAHYAASDGLSSTQILALVREHASGFADVGEPLPAGLRLLERLPARAAALAAMHFGWDGGERGVAGDPGSGVDGGSGGSWRLARMVVLVGSWGLAWMVGPVGSLDPESPAEAVAGMARRQADAGSRSRSCWASSSRCCAAGACAAAARSPACSQSPPR